ncbi:MAG: NUDIX hydrolase [Lachnospiraceae bacterium]|nr:NUDIX hydrolase [Lachnospiraceae bacterium]
MIDKFKRIKREVLRKSNVLTYCIDTMQLPDGQTQEYDMMLHNGASAVVPVTDEGKLVMVKQYRLSFDRVTLEVPAGKRDGDEEFIKAAERELLEETGYTCSKIEPFITIDTAIAYCDEEIKVFLATGLKKTDRQHTDPDEFIDVGEYELSDLKKMIFNHEIRDSKTIACIMAYSAYLENRG